MSSVVCMGELLIDFIALETGVSVGEASGFQKAPGGAPANVAVAIRKLGMPSGFIGQVGNDPFGHYLSDVLFEHGVDTAGLRFSDAARTALAFVSLRGDGERSFSFYRHPSADMLMTPDDVNYAMIDAARAFHFGSITLIHEPSKSATLAAARRALDSGLLVSYDPNLRMALWPDKDAARAGMLEGLDYAHIVKISEDELAFLTNGDVYALWREHTRAIIITLGASGSIAYTRDSFLKVEGQGVQTIDTTGAGDSFVGGLLVKLLSAPDMDSLLADALRLGDVLHFANTVGAITTTKRGAIPALPTLQEVEVMARRVG
jgi:fructokinase